VACAGGFAGGAVAAFAGGFDEGAVPAGAGCATFLAGVAPSSPRAATSNCGPRARIIKTLPKTGRDMMRILRVPSLKISLFGRKDLDREWRGWNRVILLVNLKRQRDLACGGGCGRLGVGHDLDHEAG
jgi:hypothetical protein